MNVRDSRVHNYPPRWNGAPSRDLLVIRRNHKTSEVSLDPLRWGLIPYWCEDPKGGRKPINAKCETVHSLPTFRDAYRRRRGDWLWLIDVLADLDRATAEAIIDHMVVTGLLVEDNGVLGLGSEAEAKFGRRHFQELIAAFTTPLLLAVRYGGHELGSIDPQSLTRRRGSSPAILLGGRSWRVLEVDWPHRTVNVEPAAEVGRSRWFGSSRALHAEAARAVEEVLVSGDTGVSLSTRARLSLQGLREESGGSTERD
jgi:hypothetical protein